MRYVLFICTDPTAEPYVEAEDNAGEWVASLQDSGSYVLGDRLRPVEDATTVRVRGGERLLLEHMTQLAQQRGLRTLDLTSRPSRESALRLYESVGFRRRETNVLRFTPATD